MPTPPVVYRSLSTLEDFAAVVELERVIWGPGYDEVVPVPIIAVTVLRGGVLIGAFDGDRMVGFVYSLPGIKHGQPTQWSHMLGVLSDYRSAGVGRELKLLQRERTLTMGLDLIEWTYDPMQALNAHLNFTKLGVIVEEYEVNVYGTSSSPLHRGNPTDRFVAEWWVRKPHVERRLAADGGNQALTMRTSEVAEAPAINEIAEHGGWPEPAGVDLSRDDRRLLVWIPTRFTEMLATAPDLALAWRMSTREMFTTYFARDYRAVDFFLDRERSSGAYLLTRPA